MTKKVRKMDNETIRKLAGLLPINNNFSLKFVPDCFKDIDVEYQPTFEIKPWSSAEVREIASKMSTKVDNEYILSQIKTKIVGWDNLINIATQEEVVFSVEAIETLPQKVLNELTAELLRISGLGS